MGFSHFLLAFSVAISLAVIASATEAGYGANPNLEKPNLEKDKLLSTLIGIQGLIYCKSGSKLIPLAGAVARITCLAVDEYGYETSPLSILSGSTDANGYFLAILSPSEVEDKSKIKECRAFLEMSPLLKSCNVPTDVNKGISGALLNSFHFLTHKNMKLFTVGPFFYTADNGY